MKASTLSRIFFLSSSSLILISFFSCSHMQTKQGELEEETLREVSLTREELIPWTDELEADRLTQTITATEGIEKRVVLSPLAVLANTAEKTVSPIYPALEWVGKLDYRFFPEPAKSLLDNFCTAFVTGEKTERYVTEQGRYLLALFYYDISSFLAPLKQTNASQEPAPDSVPSAELQPEEASSSEAISEPMDFETFRYGEPFISADFLQVPLQFSGDLATMNAVAFLVREKDAWKIDQIQIRAWEEKGK